MDKKTEKVREYVLDALQREYSFKDGVDVDSINFIEEGYMDSLGLIQFIVELEDEFGIQFTEDEMNLLDFRRIGGLIELVERKQTEKLKR